jgi:D-glycero-beta-D-manno-heptose 1-phosphate adenylyltransferase
MKQDHSRKILTLDQMVRERKRLMKLGRKLVFTNGCFDIIHAGHVDYLAFARSQGDALVVGLNSDASVRRNKGPSRPVVKQADRAKVMAALEDVDYVIIFGQNEPASVIAKIIPDVLVKGEDWAHYVSGRETVERHGGKVVLARFLKGRSTTNIIKRIILARQSGVASKQQHPKNTVGQVSGRRTRE